MKLVLKLTLIFVLASAIGMAVVGYLHVERDKTSFDQDMRSDHQLLGTVLRTSLLADADLEGTARAPAIIAAANGAARTATFEWVPASALGGELVADRQWHENGALVSLFPVRRGNVVEGAVRLREPLEERDRYAAAALRDTVVSIACIIALCLVVAFLSSRALVGRPMEQLVAQARRIGKGVLTEPLDLSRDDELAELATEMNAMCEALVAAREDVSAETQSRISTLEQLRHADRLATVGKLAAGIAHELGTPLSIVAGHAQMIVGGEVQGERAIQSASTIDREAARMARIVRQLLDFTRRKGPEATDCDVTDIAERTVKLFTAAAQKAKVTIVLDGPREPLVVRGDGESMQQVFTNLMANAIDAMPTGGTLHVELARADGFIRLDVRDTGTGMAKSVAEHVFEPFFTTKEPGEGTGLGLSVVDGIVRDHGGRVTVESAPGQGTTFSVLFPEMTGPRLSSLGAAPRRPD